jgi:exonuclease SbcD
MEVELELRRRVDRFIDQAAEELDAGLPAVLAFHGSIDGAALGAERSITLGQDLVLARSVVAHPRVDYVALGHIHKHQSLGEHPPLIYPGSIERIDFGEADDAKGCVLVELEPGAARWRFQPLAARPFVTIALDVRQSSQPEPRLAAAIEKRDLRGAVVRAQITASREQAAQLREERIREQLEAAGAFQVAAVAIEVPRAERSRYSDVERELMEGLTPRRALELYLLAKNTPPERIAALLAAHDELATGL